VPVRGGTGEPKGLAVPSKKQRSKRFGRDRGVDPVGGSQKERKDEQTNNNTLPGAGGGGGRSLPRMGRNSTFWGPSPPGSTQKPVKSTPKKLKTVGVVGGTKKKEPKTPCVKPGPSRENENGRRV